MGAILSDGAGAAGAARPVSGAPSPGYLLEELTWAQAEALLAQDLVVLLPIGAATKEHGRHLPLGTDYFVAETLRKSAAARTPVLTVPTVAYGYYPAFVSWPGSVSVRPDVFAGTVADIVRSLARHGWRRFCLLNTGVSTSGPLDAACRELASELPSLRIAMTRGLGEAAWRELREEHAGTHAGEQETSLMLAVRSDLVAMELAAAEVIPKPESFRTGGRRPPLASLYGEMTRAEGGPREFYTASGVHGDATLASRTKGEALLEATINDLIVVIEELARLS